MPIHSLMQNVTGSVALSEQAGVVLNSGSVTGLLVGGQPLSSTNVLPVSVSGTFNVSAVGPETSAISSSIPSSASLAGFRDPGGLLQPATVDNFGAQIITGSVTVAFPLSQFVKQDSTPWIISGTSWIPTVTGSVRVENVVNVSGSNWTPTITGSVVVANQVNVTGTVGIASAVAVTQGTSPWIISGSSWVPTITGSVVVTNKVDVKTTAASASVGFVSASANTNVTIASANPNRLGIIVYNDTSKLLYVKLGVSASVNDYTTQLAKDDNYEVPFGYQGRIDAFTVGAVTGVVRITEIV